MLDDDRLDDEGLDDEGLDDEGLDDDGAEVVEIEAAMDGVAHAATRVRFHERTLALARVDLDRTGATLLRHLAVCHGKLRLCDLADRLGVDAPAVTRKVQQLEREGLVARSLDGSDRRAFRLRTTRQGERVLGRILAARRTRLAELLSDWSNVDRVTFARLLRRFAEDLLKDQTSEDSRDR